MEHYINMSLELNLFFARIMKEHAIFLEAAFQPRDKEFIKTADWYKTKFEDILEQSVMLANGTVRMEVLKSGEIVTIYTPKAEEITQFLTGIAIDQKITRAQQQLNPACTRMFTRQQMEAVRIINREALYLLNGFIEFKERIYKEVTACCMFTANYPLLIAHIIREAKLYQSYLSELESRGYLCADSMKQQEQFWNQIMMEHALFIRGLLDPTEAALIGTADGFAKEYEKLIKEARDKCSCTMDNLTEKTIELTCRYRDFKAAGTKGISDCEISSIILPLLADHVLREANHYLRLLEE